MQKAHELVGLHRCLFPLLYVHLCIKKGMHVTQYVQGCHACPAFLAFLNHKTQYVQGCCSCFTNSQDSVRTGMPCLSHFLAFINHKTQYEQECCSCFTNSQDSVRTGMPCLSHYYCFANSQDSVCAGLLARCSCFT